MSTLESLQTSPVTVPNGNARDQYRPWQHDDRQIQQHPLLALREQDSPVFRRLGPDGDQILLLSQPADHVEEKVAVPLLEIAVRGKIRIPDNDHPRLDRRLLFRGRLHFL